VLNTARAALIFGLGALALARDTLSGAMVPGAGMTEAWARMGVSRQVLRWLRGEAPIGHADLLSAPDGRPFWPVDPLLQLIEAPLIPLLGDARAFSAVCGILLTLAGLGPWTLARVAGASEGGALAAGALGLCAPFMFTHINDGILECAAIGPLCLTIAVTIRAVRDGDRRSFVLALVSTAALGLTSPYLLVYLALGCGLAAPFTWRRSWLRYAAAATLGSIVALAPIWLSERHDAGRLSARYERSGFHLTPEPLVDHRGQVVKLKPPSAPLAGPKVTRPPDDRATRVARRWPGGVALSLGVLLALLTPSARPWAILALVLWFGGPAPQLVQRALGYPSDDLSGPLNGLLRALPLTQSLGNPGRLIAAFLPPATIAAALVATRWRALGPLFALGALLELRLHTPELRLLSLPFTAEPEVLHALTGPVVVFPSGDPPAWQPNVSHGEALLYAGIAGAPLAYDYGVNPRPADGPWLTRLAETAALPLGRAAWRLRHQAPGAEFQTLLLLEDRLHDEARDRLKASLEARATLLHQGERMSAWALPAWEAWGSPR
jgi:hypothetical protein